MIDFLVGLFCLVVGSVGALFMAIIGNWPVFVWDLFSFAFGVWLLCSASCRRWVKKQLEDL